MRPARIFPRRSSVRRWRGGWQGRSTTNLLPREVAVISIELKGFCSRLTEWQDRPIVFNGIPRPAGRIDAILFGAYGQGSDVKREPQQELMGRP